MGETETVIVLNLLDMKQGGGFRLDTTDRRVWQIVLKRLEGVEKVSLYADDRAGSYRALIPASAVDRIVNIWKL